MFKGHPKGLYVAFFANMGERFGFYTMMAILAFFLDAKFGLTPEQSGGIYSWFYFAIYGLALVGGFLADRLQNYKGVILTGILIMMAGYVLMGIPGMSYTVTLIGLFTIAFGNGLFKGNLQAVVGQIYDDPKYSGLRDYAFSIFYMGINIGAFFAPNAATSIRNWWLAKNNYLYDGSLPALCHSFINGTIKNLEEFQLLANKVSGKTVTDLSVFAKEYLEVFVTGYNYAFLIAASAMFFSFLIFALCKGILPDKKTSSGKSAASVSEISKEEEKQRITALILVFIVVIFFWMSFHQNGLTMNYFARDYTVKEVDSISYMFFDLKTFLCLLASIIGLVFLVGKNTPIMRSVGAVLLVAGATASYYFYGKYPATNPIDPETFQQFNAIFIVFLTPVVVGFFASLSKKGKEPSTPKKIGFGMIIAAIAFFILVVGSLELQSPAQLAGKPSPERVSVYWLINSYFVLTIAELFLSPMGLSFVSKVAPPRFQGLMQGGWLGATALGNKLLFIGPLLWMKIAVWQVWSIFVVCCILSAIFIFSIMKRLEKATK